MNEFIEVKTAELTGTALDWAVEAALGGVRVGHRVDFPHGYWCVGEYKPSWRWDQGGPLIEKYQIDLKWGGIDGKAYWWSATHQDLAQFQIGATPLIAACRAIVAAHLGETVSVPKELMV